ncbi:hypothetical protein L7F22_005490 [Adiantum nelumboides]|nr:hypothetical protein [Adiantum nelumboides]
MASIDSVSIVEDKFRMSSEGTAVTPLVMDMGLMNTEVFQGSNHAITMEAVKAQCECCNLTEECTPAYIAHVQGLYFGRWICGLCAEAVKEEHRRGGGGDSSKEGLEDALEEHMRVCMKFNRPERIGSPVADISAAVRRLLRRSTDVRLTSRSAPSSPGRRAPLSRANSCFGSFPPISEAPV